MARNLGLGLVVAVVLLGPVLGPGALFNLDLVAHDHWPFPRSFWGIGPELPRSVPLELVLSALAWASSGAVAVKLFYLAAFSSAFAGAHRWAIRLGTGDLGALAAALLYATSPFLVTRVAVGHLTMVGAYAVLPWVLPTLLRPSADLRATVRAAAPLALMGFYGGLVLAAVTLTGLTTERQRRPLAVGWRLAAVNLPWLVPGFVLFVQGPGLAGSEAFPSGVDSPAAAAGLVAGTGFWQPLLQPGGTDGVRTAVCGLVLLGLVVRGWQGATHDVRRAAAILMVFSVGIVLADAAPGSRTVYEVLTGIGPAAALREPHRLLVLHLVWAAPLAVRGAQLLAPRVRPEWRRSVLLVPAALAVVLGGPALWGISDRMAPVDVPDGWHEARATIAEQPGTTLVLPWYRYLDIDAARNQRVLNPSLRFFGPDVIVSSDLGLPGGGAEAVDPREPAIEELLAPMRRGEPVAPELTAAGVRWIVILHEVDYEGFLQLLDVPGLTPVLADVDIDLIRVDGVAGPLVNLDGLPVEHNTLAAPLMTVATDEPVVWSRPYATGWMRGWSTGNPTATGTIRFDGGSGIVWYWPAALVLLSNLMGILTYVATLRGGRRSGYHDR